MEKIDAIFNGVLDEHALGISLDESGRGFSEIVGHEEGWLVMAEIGDDKLSDGLVVALQVDTLIEDARSPVLAGDAVEFNTPPMG